MVEESNQTEFFIQFDASSFTEFEISVFEISRFDCTCFQHYKMIKLSLTVAPPLDKISQQDVEMYSSRSVPVATKARVNHMETLRTLQLPWWRKLGDEFQETEIPEEEVYLF